MNWSYRNTVLSLCTVAFFVTMAGRLAISPVVPDITAELGVSNAVVGTALTGMWLAYALTQFPSGLLADRYGERLVILVSVGGTGVFGLCLVVAPHFAIFFVGTVLLGAAAGLHYSVATTLLTRTYTDLGTAVGIHNSGAPAAGLVTPVVVTWIAATYGWRLALGLTTVISIPVFVLFFRYIRPTEPRYPNQRIREKLKLVPLLEILSRPTISFTVLVAIICDFTWQGIASFLPTFLIQYQDYSPTVAGTLFAAYFLVQGVLQIGVGSLSDRYGRDSATALCLLSGIAALGLLVATTRFALIALSIVLLGLSMGWGAAVMPRFMDHLSGDERGVGFGFIRTVYMIVASTGSVVTGLVADRYGWAISFAVLIALLGVGLGLLALNSLFGLDL
ncbi:MFS transporter [Natrinema versiforme]|uniref:MFS transporter n=1 Tax=Natrinema versiforme TaxID=88724 RepID=A0A4P8WP21_9EURY|nr:MFS transporter [Natrinema versiforme]QCS44962.1 MFS transporter [Natrinema versiforme]